jgi:hypothetical protein
MDQNRESSSLFPTEVKAIAIRAVNHIYYLVTETCSLNERSESHLPVLEVWFLSGRGQVCVAKISALLLPLGAYM